MKNVPSPQEECVNVKPAYFKHTFKESTALIIKSCSIALVSQKTMACTQSGSSLSWYVYENLQCTCMQYQLDITVDLETGRVHAR